MKKGFTLVELLAVIVILAIIAVITIPMISNVIEKSKLGAMEDSAYGLIEAANYYYAEHMNEMSSNKLFVIDNGVGTSEEKLNYKGKIEGNAKVLLASNGKVALCLTNGKSYAKKGITDSKVVMHTVSENTQCDITTSENGDVVIDITGGSTSDTTNIKLEELENKINNYVPIYNPEDDYFYVNGTRWKKAGLLSLTLFDNGTYPANVKFISNSFYWDSSFGIVKFEDSLIKLIKTGTTENNSTIVTESKIDLTNYSKITISISECNIKSVKDSLRLYVLTQKNGNSASMTKDLNSIRGVVTGPISLELDISTIEGEFYIGLGIGDNGETGSNSSYAYIDKITLE